MYLFRTIFRDNHRLTKFTKISIQCKSDIKGTTFSLFQNVCCCSYCIYFEFLHAFAQRSLITGCLTDDTRLEYRVEFPHEGDTVVVTTSDLSVSLSFKSDVQVDNFEVTVTPVLPDLNLIGTPLATTLIEGKFVCLHVPMTRIWVKHFSTSKKQQWSLTNPCKIYNYMYVQSENEIWYKVHVKVVSV